MAAELRPYQRRALDELYSWLSSHETGNPCLVLPTGAGKSHIVAAFCQEVKQGSPRARILMLTHVRELIEQNAQKLRQHWPNAPLGIFSAGLNQKRIESITFAGIQSVRDKADLLGHRDVVLIDEAHLVSHRDEGGYRELIDDLIEINPALRVIGLTATPWRLGHGRIDERGALFDALIEPVTIEELVKDGYLAPLRSRLTQTQVSAAGVHRRGGEYIEADLQKAVNKAPLITGAVDDILRWAGERRHWLLFCTGVKHAEAVADELKQRGISAATVTGAMRPMERAHVLDLFKRGRVTAVTNANVLTTGFDFPDIDLIAMLRPTMSPTLYVQMAGRGMRLKSHTDHCLVLDFAGVVQQHGPITAVEPPTASGEGTGEAPVKICPQCQEIVHAAVRICPSCGFEFPPPEPKKPDLDTESDIMGQEGRDVTIAGWTWDSKTPKSGGPDMAVVCYDTGGWGRNSRYYEHLCVQHPGYAGKKANERIQALADAAGADLSKADDLDQLVNVMNAAKPPLSISVGREGKWWRVLSASWTPTPEHKFTDDDFPF